MVIQGVGSLSQAKHACAQKPSLGFQSVLFTPLSRSVRRQGTVRHTPVSSSSGTPTGHQRCSAARTDPTATWASTEASRSESALSSQQEEYVSRLAQAAEHTSAGCQAAFNWMDKWYPVGFVKDFDAAVPHRFVLLGIPLVIWHDPTHISTASTSSSGNSTRSSDEGWRVFSDACPHRLVPLSEGRITPSGRLECPYHGWQFNAAGGCEVIPQEGNLHNPRSCATAFPCVVKQGLLFVKPQPLPKAPVSSTTASHISSPNGAAAASSSQALHNSSSNGADPYADVPTIPELDQEGWVSQDTWRDVPYDWASLLENVLDASHVPFTHHKSISNRNIRSNYNMQLTQQVSPSGFSGIWPSGPRGGQLGPQETQFVPPCLMSHKIVAKGFDSMVVVYAVPVAPGRCRLLNRNTFKFSKGGGIARALMRLAPGWAIHMGTQVPLEDDQIFLHIGEMQYVAARQQGKPAAQAYYLPSKADTYITAFRRWIASIGGGGPFGDVTQPNYLEQIGARQSREQLLDRYSQHTANCAQCQAALKQIRTARRVLTWVAGVAASLALLTAAAAAAVAAGSGAAASAAASTQGSGLMGKLAQGVTGLLVSVCGLGGTEVVLSQAAVAASDAAVPLGRLALWAGAAGVACLVQQQLGHVEGKLLHGDYPPPRNTDRT